MPRPKNGCFPSALRTADFPTHISRHSHRYALFSLSAHQSCIIMPPHWKESESLNKEELVDIWDINVSNICILYYITCPYTYTLTCTPKHTPKVTHLTNTTCLLLDLVCITRLAKDGHFSLHKPCIYMHGLLRAARVYISECKVAGCSPFSSVCCLLPMSPLTHTFSRQNTELTTRKTRYR